MPRKSPVSVFIAAASVLIASGSAQMSHAQGAGGLKEWNTDQGIDEKSKMDAEAKALQKKAEQEDVCVPIGEGENCW